MSSFDSIIEAWFLKAIEIYPQSVRDGMTRMTDRFRNPAAFGLRESLATLVKEMAGEMKIDAITAALDGIVRLRAVQEYTPESALAFAPRLGDVIREQHAEALFPNVEQRICLLVDCALEQYAACRKEIAQVRSRAEWRLQALEPWMRQIQ